MSQTLTIKLSSVTRLAVTGKLSHDLASSTRDPKKKEDCRKGNMPDKENPKQEKRKKTESKKNENFEIKTLEDNKMQLNKHVKVTIQLKTKVWIEQHTGFL
jgi:hypothetical protein